jgi:hypothetical protein
MSEFVLFPVSFTDDCNDYIYCEAEKDDLERAKVGRFVEKIESFTRIPTEEMTVRTLAMPKGDSDFIYRKQCFIGPVLLKSTCMADLNLHARNGVIINLAKGNTRYRGQKYEYKSNGLFGPVYDVHDGFGPITKLSGFFGPPPVYHSGKPPNCYPEYDKYPVPLISNSGPIKVFGRDRWQYAIHYLQPKRLKTVLQEEVLQYNLRVPTATAISRYTKIISEVALVIADYANECTLLTVKKNDYYYCIIDDLFCHVRFSNFSYDDNPKRCYECLSAFLTTIPQALLQKIFQVFTDNTENAASRLTSMESSTKLIQYACKFGLQLTPNLLNCIPKSTTTTTTTTNV